MSLFSNNGDLFAFALASGGKRVRRIADGAHSCERLIPPLPSVSAFFLFLFRFSAPANTVVALLLFTLFPMQPLRKAACSSQTTIAASSPDRKWMHSVCVVRPLVPHPAVSFILMRSSFPWRTSSGSILDAFSIWLSGCFSLLLLLLLSLKCFQHSIRSDN